MKITELKLQKNGKFYNVYIDGDFLCSVNDELIITHHLFVGKEINGEELLEIKKEASLRKAYNLSINYLAIRNRTEKEVEDYLVGKGFDQNTIRLTLKKLKEYKFIDDEYFIELYIKGKIGEGHSKNKIKYNLIKKGLVEEVIETKLEIDYPHHIEIAYLQKEIEKYKVKYDSFPYRDKVVKISQSFQRKGYELEDIQSVINDIISQETDFDEEFVKRLEKLGNKYVEKYKRKGLSEREIKQKTTEALYRKGYGFDAIKKYLESLE